SICYLRGAAYSQQSDLDNAKQWFKKALEIDVKCFEMCRCLLFNLFFKLINLKMLNIYI
ncbi:hypothetical protein C2G38_2062531, partial [Gigaspora rosea]